jgi:hypothetical protein
VSDRTGFENFTGEHQRVTYDPDRAAQGLPPWVNEDGGQYFLDSEVTEHTEQEKARLSLLDYIADGGTV